MLMGAILGLAAVLFVSALALLKRANQSLSPRQRKGLIVGVTGVAGISMAALAIFFIATPRSYEDCVLSSMKGASGDKAVMAVRSACRAKFPLRSTTATTPTQSFGPDQLTTGSTNTAREAEERGSKSNWFAQTVPEFLDGHPQYKENNALWKDLDTEVRRLQEEAIVLKKNPFSPTILTRAHENLQTW